MITGNLRTWRTSKELKPFTPALEFLERALGENLPDGRYEIEGALMYAIISSYKTRPVEQCRFESHEKYLDIQFLLSGREEIRVADISNLTVTEPMNEKDVAFYAPAESAHRLEIVPGDFAVLFPEDGHMPGVAAGSPEDVRKVVVKIDVSVA